MTTYSASQRRIVELVLILGLTVLLGASLIAPSRAYAQTSPTLGTSASFAILASRSVTNTGPSIVNGDLGVSTGTSVTGFPPGIVTPPGQIYAADAIALQAQNDATTAYLNLANQTPCTVENVDLGGLTLTAGTYCFSSTAQLTGTLTLDGENNPNAVFIFQIGSALTTASASSVQLIRSASECNVWWQVGSDATLGTTTAFVGNLLVQRDITLTTGTTIVGRALAQRDVTMDSNTVGSSACIAAPPPRSELSLTKDDGGVTVGSGDTIRYTLNYRNSGNVDLANAILSDAVPGYTSFNAGASTAGWDCSSSPCTLNLGPLAAGASASAVFAVTVNNPSGTSLVNNTATITSGATSASASDTTPVNRPGPATGATAVPALIFTAVPTESAAVSAQSAVSGLPNTGGGAPQPTYWMTPQPGR